MLACAARVAVRPTLAQLTNRVKTIFVKMMRLACLFFVLLAGCTSAEISKSLASGAIGCPIKEIAIADETVNSGVHNFTAKCDGVDYFCTYMYPNPISCKERK